MSREHTVLTEAGEIPDHWAVKPLRELFEFGGGVAASRADLGDEGLAYLHYGDIHRSVQSFVDASDDAIPRLPMPLKRVPRRSLLRDGDIVFVDASEDESGTGKHVVVINRTNRPFISGLHTIVAHPATDDLDPLYRRFCFQAEGVRAQFRKYAVGTKVQGVNKTSIKQIVLPVPPRVEQRAIAAVLADAEDAVRLLDALLAKKRAVARALKQGLLSGRTRLPGFGQEWRPARLGNVGVVLRGVSYDPRRHLAKRDEATTIRLLRANNVQASALDFTDVHRVVEDCVSADQILRPGDVLICAANGSKELVGKAAAFASLGSLRYTFGAFMACFRPDTRHIDPRFASHLFQGSAYRDQVALALAGSSINNLGPTQLSAMEFVLPSQEEQHAIAAVLDDVDADLDALVARLHKERAVQEALTQQLLSGRIRLALSEGSATQSRGFQRQGATAGAA